MRLRPMWRHSNHSNCFRGAFSKTRRSARGAKEHALAQIGGYLNHSRGEFDLPIERVRRDQPVERACNVRRNTALQGSSATSVVLAANAGFVAIIPSKWLVDFMVGRGAGKSDIAEHSLI
jgi:hypothetical protein